MKKLLLLFSFLLFSYYAISQDTVYAKTYGGNAYETAIGIDTLSNDNAIVFGNSSSFGNGSMDLLVFSINKFGVIRWQKNYGTTYLEQATSYTRTRNNEYVICGTTDRNIGKSYDIWVIKIDSLGNTLWEKTFGSVEWDFAKDIVEDKYNNIIVCGQTYNQSSTGDAFVLKLNSLGDSIWWKQMNASQTDIANSVITVDTTIFIAGESTSFAIDSTKTSFLARLNSTGIFLWQKTFCDTTENVIYSLINNGDSLILAGYLLQANQKKTQYIIITNIDGLLLNQITYANSSNFELTIVKRSVSGNYCFLGHTDVIVGGSQDIYYLILSSDFNFLKARTFGKWDKEYTAGFCEMRNKQLLIAGTTNSFENVLSAIYVVKTDTNLVAPLTAININLSANDNNFSEAIKVFPNPSSDLLTINITDVDISNLHFSIINQLGQNCEYKTINQSNETMLIDISQLKEGYYILKINNDSLVRYCKILVLK